MHAITHPLVTAHGLRKLERERADLRGWLEHLKLRVQRGLVDPKKDKGIALILSEEHVVANRLKRTDAAYEHVTTMPPTWSNKTEARAGDTVYLRHKDNIRGLMLTAACNADPTNGKVSITSPIGLTLVGRHVGDTVRINTLDGDVKYEILKIT